MLASMRASISNPDNEQEVTSRAVSLGISIWWTSSALDMPEQQRLTQFISGCPARHHKPTTVTLLQLQRFKLVTGSSQRRPRPAFVTHESQPERFRLVIDPSSRSISSPFIETWLHHARLRLVIGKSRSDAKPVTQTLFTLRFN